jgi:hypothetical protein
MKSLLQHPIRVLAASFIAATIFSVIILLYDTNDRVLCCIGLYALLPPSAIALFAYSELEKFANININDNLMRLDKLWHTAETIKARKIIDQLFQECYRIECKECVEDKYETAMDLLSKRILELSRPDTVQKIIENDGKFIYVLALIEFFDTLGFLYLNGSDIEKERINSLFKNSTIFYYDVTKAYIEHVTTIPDAEDRFKHFSSLYNKLQEKKVRRRSL